MKSPAIRKVELVLDGLDGKRLQRDRATIGHLIAPQRQTSGWDLPEDIDHALFGGRIGNDNLALISRSRQKLVRFGDRFRSLSLFVCLVQRLKALADQNAAFVLPGLQLSQPLGDHGNGVRRLVG